jgi:hypothetical protein
MRRVKRPLPSEESWQEKTETDQKKMQDKTEADQKKMQDKTETDQKNTGKGLGKR